VNVLNTLPERIVSFAACARGRTFGSGLRLRACRSGGRRDQISFHKLLKLAFDGIFNFSTVPLTMIFVMQSVVRRRRPWVVCI
jgi:hypothetical protein